MFQRVRPIILAIGLLASHAVSESEPEVLSVTTEEFLVPPGNVEECVYTPVTTDRELNVIAVKGHQGPGGHHIAVYYTDTPHTPERFPCTGSDMVAWHFVVAVGPHGGEQGKGFQLPEGLAMKIPAGKQFILQAHHINATETTMVTEDSVELHLVDPANVRAYAQTIFFLDEKFEIPPGQSAQSVTTCTVQHFLKGLALRGHMHQFGTRYRLEIVDPSGQPVTTLYEETWEPSYTFNPPVRQYPIESPLELPAGTRLRQTCQWYNSTESPLRHPREMCAALLTAFSDEKTYVEDARFCKAEPS